MTAQRAGYSGTPLSKKLGLAAGMSVYLHKAPSGYLDLLAPLPDGVRFIKRSPNAADLIQAFVTRRDDLAKLLVTWRKAIEPHVPVWVSWPKKSSGEPTDITEDTIREVALPLGFVDIKVCAVDHTWSGLKLVVRKELR